MAKRLFITATNTDIGKTYVTLQLLETLAKLGQRVGVIKPIETGVDSKPLDGTLLLEQIKRFNPTLNHLNVNDIVPYQFKLPAAPFVAKADQKINLQVIEKAINKLEPFCDIILLEGAGGLMVPVDDNLFIIDMIKQLSTDAFLVVPSRLGSINDTLLSQKALRDYNISFEWGVNLYEDKETFKTVTAPFYDKYFNNYYIIQNDLETLGRKWTH
jgi:dethiobiotin synthetase